MEIRFKNNYTRNKELIKEISRFYYFQRKWIIVCDIVLAISFLVNIVSATLGQAYNVGVFFSLPLFIALQLFAYYRQVNTMIKRDNEVHGKEIEVETLVTDEWIQYSASTGTVNRITYDKIRNAVQTKHLILLRSKSNLIYIFKNDTFDVGTKEEFISFLSTKGIVVKGK